MLAELDRNSRVTGGENTSPSGPRSVIVIPTYNEASNLALLVAAIREVNPGIDLLVVDDNSPDGTGRVADELATRHDGLTVMHRPGKQGLGRAYVAGFQYALAMGYEYIVEMDADFSHAPADLARILAEAQQAPVVIGSRYVQGGRVEGWSPLRRLISRGGNWYARRLLGLQVHDATSGFRCFHRSAIERLDLSKLRSNGYAFQVEMVYACAEAGMSIREIPIVFRDRLRGRSKMSPRIALEAAWLVLRLRSGLTAAAVATLPQPAVSGARSA